MSRKFFVFYLVSFVACQLSSFVFSQQTVLNRGISFGLASSNILSMALLVLCIVLYVLTRHEQKKYPIAYGLLVGAVVSNLFDRFVYGGVRDVFRLPFIGISNNLADWVIFLTLIFIGVREYTHGTSRSR